MIVSQEYIHKIFECPQLNEILNFHYNKMKSLVNDENQASKEAAAAIGISSAVSYIIEKNLNMESEKEYVFGTCATLMSKFLVENIKEDGYDAVMGLLFKFMKSGFDDFLKRKKRFEVSANDDKIA